MINSDYIVLCLCWGQMATTLGQRIRSIFHRYSHVTQQLKIMVVRIKPNDHAGKDLLYRIVNIDSV